MHRFTSHGAARRLAYMSARGRQAAINLIATGSIRGVRSQHPADFLCFRNRLGGRQDPGFPGEWRVDPQLHFDDPARVGVVLNCFYPELLPELLERLELIPVPFDVFVTNVSGVAVTLPAHLGNMRHGVVLTCANHGRDILPLVEVINAGLLDPYDVILKVHTKKSPWRAEHAELSGSGEQWRRSLLDALLPSRQGVEDILASFGTDPHLGVVTAPGSIAGPEFWGGDKRIVNQILRRIELGPVDESLRFPAGSMYWARGFVLQGLRSLNLIADDFDEEEGQIDGTTAHAVERIIGVLTEEAGLRLSTSEEVTPGLAAAQPEIIRRLLPDTELPTRATVVPFYLPQFHPSARNDEWWGKGFTEWTNVTSAIPVYEGHFQPKIPTDLGFYDLRIDEVRREQLELASAHGVAGFMYYYYWFSGERLLNLPIESLKASGIEQPFCLMWANENWTRRWDGRSEDILVGQDYDKVPAEDFIDDVMEFLLDHRYMRVEGKAVLAVYRPGQMSDFGSVAREWRRRAREAGVGELLLLSVAVAAEFDAIDASASEEVDGTLEFPPHNLPWVAGPAMKAGLDNRMRGNFMSYQATADASITHAREMRDDEYPGVMVDFDNTARRQWKPDIWYGSNPYTFHRWLGAQLDSLTVRPRSQRLLFINAWNEWAEGAILEPTTRFGRTFLLAVRSAVRS